MAKIDLFAEMSDEIWFDCRNEWWNLNHLQEYVLKFDSFARKSDKITIITVRLWNSAYVHRNFLQENKTEEKKYGVNTI